MTTSEWLSTIALIISTGGFAIQARNWFFASPRLHLSVMSDAVVFPDDKRGPRMALTVINRGAAPTMLTHMIVFVYDNWWTWARDKPSSTGVINSPHIPAKLEVNGTWNGWALWNDELKRDRPHKRIYVGVYSAHRKKRYLVRVPEARKVPEKKLEA